MYFDVFDYGIVRFWSTRWYNHAQGVSLSDIDLLLASRYVDVSELHTLDHKMLQLLTLCEDVGLAPALDPTDSHFLNVPHIGYEELTLEDEDAQCPTCEKILQCARITHVDPRCGKCESHSHSGGLVSR